MQGFVSRCLMANPRIGDKCVSAPQQCAPACRTALANAGHPVLRGRYGSIATGVSPRVEDRARSRCDAEPRMNKPKVYHRFVKRYFGATIDSALSPAVTALGCEGFRSPCP